MSKFIGGSMRLDYNETLAEEEEEVEVVSRLEYAVRSGGEG